MSAPAAPRPSPPPFVGAPPVEKTLRKLFLTIFLRGYSARGVTKANSPMSPALKLSLVMGLYALVGLSALIFLFQPVFVLSGYLHCMSFMFVGMFVTASVGEVLFNKEEAEILLHRPILPQSLLKAKIWVLAYVSLLMAGAMNLCGLLVGLAAKDGGWTYPFAHALSTVLESLFCAGCAVLVLQFCLRWFGRERVENLMTGAQVVLTVVMIVGSQLFSQQLHNLTRLGDVDWNRWWIDVLPPAWFAAMDDALAGSHSSRSWLLGAVGLAATLVTLRLVFGRLAESYQSGLKALGESGTRTEKLKNRFKFVRKLVAAPPLRWALKGPVEQASCVLCTAYLLRDRDT
jgi:ABC-2 type transport system permease protein